jgi:hypothetical protein
MPSIGDGFCCKALINISAQHAYDLPDPTGPMTARTKALLCKNLYISGLLEKFKLIPPSGRALLLFSLTLLIYPIFDMFPMSLAHGSVTNSLDGSNL